MKIKCEYIFPCGFTLRWSFQGWGASGNFGDTPTECPIHGKTCKRGK